MSRADLLTHVQHMLPEIAIEAGVTLAEDTTTQGGIAVPGITRELDAAVRDLGSDTGNQAAGEALIEYHVLRRCRYAVGSRLDFDATAVQAKRSQIYNQIDALIKDAADRCAATGHPIAQTSGSRLVTLNLDYLEPEALA